ncbi:MAG TPA: hydrogenase small subunit, partial [Deinococcales bacterium]|nr:hydrogenase small subunit [Deinococcales bacterium]
MAAAGDQAEAALDDTIKNHKGKYIAVFEGSVPVGEHARYLTVGAHGETGADRVKRVARDAQLVLNAGSCAAFGNLPVASPNPTTAQGIGAFLAAEGIRTPVINIPGCPMNSISFVGTVLEVVMFGRVPQLDAFSRPQWAYGKRIHDQCERRGHFDAGEFVESFNDVDGLKRGLCLYKVGCKGPFTYNNCGIARFNQGASWPIYAGHGCIGCSEPSFMDALAPFESPVNARKYGIPGGTDVTADQVGKIAVGVAAVAMAAHAGATLLRASSDPKGEDQQ